MSDELSLCVSRAMQTIRELVIKVANTNINVLLRGESGVGKDVVARVLHTASTRADKRFIKIDCAALPGKMLASELFGHENGWRAGTYGHRPGTLTAEDTGTLLFDDIVEMPLELQAKLVHVLRARDGSRVGAEDVIATNVRVIAATNRDLERASRTRQFREDLYHLLNAIEILIPPLRERREEIPILADYFLRKFNREFGRAVDLPRDAIRLFMQYHWPGNVRELETRIKRIVGLGGARAVRKEVLAHLSNGNGACRSVSTTVLANPERSALKACARQAVRHAEGVAIKKVLEAAVRLGHMSADRDVERLKQDLAAAPECLQPALVPQAAAHEELQPANEKVQSTHDELRRITGELRNRNLELSQAKNDFANLLASVQVPIIMLGPDLRIRRYTPVAETVLNLTAADIGRAITDINLSIDIPDLESMLAEVLETVSAKERKVRDRQGRWYLLRVRPYRIPENKIDGAVLVLDEVDILKRHQETLGRQAELLEQTHAPIFMWEWEGGITYWNRGAEETYGYTRAQAMGRKPYELLATSPPSHIFRDALLKDGEWNGELVHTRSDGQLVVVDSRMVIEQRSDRHRLVFETNHVITERKQMEKALRDRAEELTLADRAKNEFLAMLAHELRNPLAPLTSALWILNEPASTAEMLARARSIMCRQIQNMTRIVDDLLDVTRLTRGTIQLRVQPVKIATMLAQVAETFQHEIEGRGQVLSMRLPPNDVVVAGDPVRLEQVFANLLSNASKFTRHRGRIWLTAERSPEAKGETGEVVVRVRDNGMGIRAELLPHVFDLFMQADSSARRTRGGLGVGLTVVRRLVELHRGRVEASSGGPGQGSEFVVRLPLMSCDALITEDTSSTESDLSPVVTRRILVVDDDKDAARSMAMALSLDGHDVKVTHDGPSTLTTALAFRPQVVFLDIGMPGMDGYETAAQLRRLPGLDDTLVIALTGFSQDSHRLGLKEARFDHYLTKPVQFAAVRRTIVEHRPPG